MAKTIKGLDGIKTPMTSAFKGVATSDRLTNSITGQGTLADKNVYNKFMDEPALSETELNALYLHNWLAAKVVDAIPHDMIRAWRTVDGLSPQDQKVFAKAQKRFKIKHLCEEALKNSRLYGGAGILIGIKGHGADSTPLDITKVKKGQLKYLHQVDSTELTVDSIQDNPLKEGFREPLLYNVGSSKIHSSRVIPFIGVKLPFRLQQRFNYWGASILQKMKEAIEHVAVAYGAGSSMLHEASLDIISIEGLFNYIGDKCGEEKILKRMALADLTKSIHNMLIKDKDEDFDKITQNFAGIPDMMREMVIAVSGASETPITRLLGISPSGLNATGEHDLVNYYDTVASRQDVSLAPKLEVLDTLLQLNEFGSEVETFTTTFNPLWQPTRGQESDIQQKVMKGHLDASRFLPESVIIAKMAQQGYYDIAPDKIEEYAKSAAARAKENAAFLEKQPKERPTKTK